MIFSPDEKQSVLFLRLHRSRSNDPIHVLEPRSQRFGERLQPAMDDDSKPPFAFPFPCGEARDPTSPRRYPIIPLLPKLAFVDPSNKSLASCVGAVTICEFVAKVRIWRTRLAAPPFSFVVSESEILLTSIAKCRHPNSRRSAMSPSLIVSETLPMLSMAAFASLNAV